MRTAARGAVALAAVVVLLYGLAYAQGWNPEKYRGPGLFAERNDNVRQVCFQFTSDPKRTLRYRWSLPQKDEASAPEGGTWGTYNHCEHAQKGAVATMTVEHVTGPSTILCNIWAWVNGEKKVVDYALTQAFGDCKVSGVIP